MGSFFFSIHFFPYFLLILINHYEILKINLIFIGEYMKKIFGLLVLSVVLVVSGCSLMDSLFFKADSVEPKELSSYDGTLPEDKETAMNVVGESVGEAIASGFQGILSSEQWNDFAKTLSKNYPVLNAVGKGFLGTPSLSSKTITYSGDRDTSDGNVDFSIAITDESVKGTASGTLVVEDLGLKLKGGVDDPDNPTKGDWDFSTNAKITMDDYANSSDYTINEGLINLRAKGNGNVTFDNSEEIDTIKYYLAMDLKAGFSISGGNGKSGKFIIEFNYVDNKSLTQDELEDPDKLVQNVTLSLVVKVYDNDNKLVKTYTYTEDDLKDELNTEE